MHVPRGVGSPVLHTNLPLSQEGLKDAMSVQQSIVCSPQRSCGTQQAKVLENSQPVVTEVK